MVQDASKARTTGANEARVFSTLSTSTGGWSSTGLPSVVIVSLVFTVFITLTRQQQVRFMLNRLVIIVTVIEC